MVFIEHQKKNLSENNDKENIVKKINVICYTFFYSKV